ncbi:MAG: DeoR/GlpR transcriptional regulator [Chloroflexi bacterium HGW-Chloroflexi-3]|nr:MAG: DeoR/GlpR transcriptional regulator [Chloroflexi bacterium HGW-Chloroflexi-3]
MISDHRHQVIVNKLENQGAVSVSDLVKEFGVSEMTIRRDLDILENKGLLRRVHGGAVSQRGRSYEPPYLMRSSENQENKQRIGQLAASLVNNGDSLTLDIGTTTLEIAKNLHSKHDLTIITPSLQIANELVSHPGIRLIVSGGVLRPGELSLVGHLAERVFEEFYVDKLFLGAGAIDIRNGASEFNIEDALVKRAMVRTAKQVILVADSSKFNQVAFTSIVALKSIHTIVTDNELNPELVTQLQVEGIEVFLT